MISQKIYVRILLLGIIFSLLHTFTADAKVGETRVSSVGAHPNKVSVKTKAPLRTGISLSHPIIRPDSSMVDVVKLEGTPRQNISGDLKTAEGIGQGAAHTQPQGINQGSTVGAQFVGSMALSAGGGGHTIQSVVNEGSTLGAQFVGSSAPSAGGVGYAAPSAGGAGTIDPAAGAGNVDPSAGGTPGYEEER